MSDEFIRGYIGRIAALEVILSEEKTLNYLKRPVLGEPEPPTSDKVFWFALSRYAGVSVQDLIANHSLIDFASPALRDFPGVVDQDVKRMADSLKRLGLASGAGQYKKFCVDCCEEQVKAHGFSFWIRRHQVPGRVFCTKHKSVLVRSESENGYFRMPSLAAPKEWVNRIDLHEGSTSSLIERYESAADMLDRSRRPFEIGRLKSVLRGLARHSGLSIDASNSDRKQDLMTPDQAFSEQVPNWLARDLLSRKSSRVGGTEVAGLLKITTMATPTGPLLAAFMSLVTKEPIANNIDLTDWIDGYNSLNVTRKSLWTGTIKTRLKSNFSTSWIAKPF